MKRLCLLLLFLLVAQPPLGAQQLVKQSTATTVNFGPFISDSDFKTVQTALTVTSMTVKLIKQSDTFSSANTSYSPTASGGSNDCQHVASGVYNCELTAANTDTAGRLEVVVTISGALPVFHRFMVIPTTKWDETVATGPSSIDDIMEVDCSTVASTTSAMGKICSLLDGRISEYSSIKNKTSIATLASQTSFTLAAGSGNDNAYNGWVIIVQSIGASATYAAGVVQGYTGSTKTVTLRSDPAVYTMAVGDIVYLIPDRSLKPTVDNRAVLVGTGGHVGLDWANINAPATTINFSGTTVKAVTDLGTAQNVANTLMNTTYESTYTFKNFLQFGSSSLFGKYSATGSTYNFRDLADTKNRVVYTTGVNARTSVTLSPD